LGKVGLLSVPSVYFHRYSLGCETQEELSSEELHNVNSSPIVIRMTNTTSIRWARKAARTGKDKCMHDFGGKARKKETTSKVRRGWVGPIERVCTL
jgi:hypothetical protein